MREHHSEYPSYTLPGGEIMYKEEPAKQTPYAFLRGPIVYCVDMVWNPQTSNDDVNLLRDVRINTEKLPVRMNKSAISTLGPSYQANTTYMGRQVKLTLIPFAGIGKWWRDGEQKPAKGSHAFTYAIWMNR